MMISRIRTQWCITARMEMRTFCLGVRFSFSFSSSDRAPFFLLLFFFPFCQADCIESMELPADNWLFFLLAQIAGLFTSSIFLSAITADIVVPHHTGTGRATMQTSSTHPSSRIHPSMGSVGREIVIPRIASSPRGPLLREISNYPGLFSIR